MILANVSDKNIVPIVEAINRGNVVKYLKSTEQEIDVLIYGKKTQKGANDNFLHIVLNEGLFNSLNTTNEHWLIYLQQFINNECKKVNLNKVIKFQYDNAVAESKHVTHAIGLPAYLRLNYLDLCVEICNLIVASHANIIEEQKDATAINAAIRPYMATAKYRPDLPYEDGAGQNEDMQDPGEGMHDDDWDDENDIR